MSRQGPAPSQNRYNRALVQGDFLGSCCRRATDAYFFGALDLTETPRRIAALRIRSGVRFMTFAISSSVLEALASSITRRSSLNDQRLRIARDLALKTKPPSEYVRLTALPLWARTSGEIVR